MELFNNMGVSDSELMKKAVWIHQSQIRLVNIRIMTINSGIKKNVNLASRCDHYHYNNIVESNY